MTDNSEQTINPLVSVIIPAYNRASFLKRAVRSVLGQTYRYLECIVIDDASTDDTTEVFATLYANDPRLRYIRLTVNKGAQAARNTGIKAAKGLYIAFLDSDDEWLPDKLEKQMRLFMQATQHLAVVYAGYREMLLNGEYVDHFPSIRGNIYKTALKQWICDTNTIVAKKSSLINAGLLDENIRAYQEWDLCIRLASQGKFDYVPESLAIYHHHSQPTISKDKLLSALGYLDVVEAHQDEILKFCGYFGLSNHFLSIGHHFMLGNDAIMGRNYFFKALRCAPYNISSLAFLAVSFLGSHHYQRIHRTKKKLLCIGQTYKPSIFKLKTKEERMC